MEEELRHFLLSRRAVSAEILARMESEKVDIEAVMGMTSQELKEFIPACGDRIAVINFCRRQSSTPACTNRTLSLLEKIKRGQNLHNMGDETKSKKLKETRTSVGRKPQTTRKIQLGWMLNGTPVRESKGGGRRDISINKSAKKTDILEVAKNLFFPKGKSSQGKLEDFDYDLLDFQHSKIEEHLTVGDMYEITKINVLRFYLATNEKKNKQKEKAKAKKTYRYTLNSSDDEDISDISKIGSGKSSGNSNSAVEPVPVPQNYIDFSFLDFYETGDGEKEENLNLIAFVPTETESILTAAINNVEPEVPEITLLKIHRGRVSEELIDAFQKSIVSTLKIEMILPNGEVERADDQGGVFRDTLTEFWCTFYEKCTVGTMFKVPYLRHDFGNVQWKAIAKILVKGYLEEKYFPIKLAPVFIAYCFGLDIDDDSLITDFKKFLSESEAEVLDEALNDFNSSNKDIMDFFETYESKWLPNAENVHQLIRDIAHKELIQKPAFVAKCFMQEFEKEKKFNFLDIEKTYQTLKPSAKNCLAKIVLQDDEDLNGSKKEIFDFLKKFVKESDDRVRSLFLRFCTGSDLATNQINIAFASTPVSEFQRGLVAHTCSCLLVLPLGYENYVDFRNDFNNILTTNIWIMDII